jgi:hypothetical protein
MPALPSPNTQDMIVPVQVTPDMYIPTTNMPWFDPIHSMQATPTIEHPSYLDGHLYFPSQPPSSHATGNNTPVEPNIQPTSFPSYSRNVIKQEAPTPQLSVVQPTATFSSPKTRGRHWCLCRPEGLACVFSLQSLQQKILKLDESIRDAHTGQALLKNSLDCESFKSVITRPDSHEFIIQFQNRLLLISSILGCYDAIISQGVALLPGYLTEMDMVTITHGKGKLHVLYQMVIHEAYGVRDILLNLMKHGTSLQDMCIPVYGQVQKILEMVTR